MTIKHLVLSGGGPIGFNELGVLQQLEKNGFWNINDIETIYATSVGGIISVLLCLKFDWETLNDYFIKRPWNEVYKIKLNQLFDAYSKKGIFDQNIAEIFYKPFFSARDISLEVTLKEFYNISNIEIHLFTFDINNFELCDISHITHPDLPLLTAVYMSSAIPILFSPVCMDDKCYVDGGVVCNYPLKQCILQAKNVDEIFGFRSNYKYVDNVIKEKTNMLDCLIKFSYKLSGMANDKFTEETIPNELICDAEFMKLSDIQKTLESKEMRQNLVETGIEAGKAFLLARENVTTDLVTLVDAVVLDDGIQELS